MQVQTILKPHWILPIRPHGVLLEDHCLAIDKGKITAIFPKVQVNNFEAKEVIDLPCSLLMPGLVNCHTHASMNLLRAAGPDLCTPDWLKKCIWPIEGQLMSPEFVHDGAVLGGAEMLSAGITTCHDMYFFPRNVISALRNLGMRVVQGGFVIGFASREYPDEASCLKGIRQLMKEYAADPLVSINVAPHAPYSVSKEALQASMRLAEEFDTTWQIHLSETVSEQQEAIKNFGCTPVEYLDRIGCLNNKTIAVHCVALTEHDIELLGKRGCSVVHCPTSNMRLGCGAAPVAKLIEAGANVAIGTDGAASACSIDLFAEMKLAGLLAKGLNRDPCLLSVEQLLEMGTYNGASALKLNKHTGSLEIGKQADIISVNLSQFVTVPVLDVLASLVYSGGRDCVEKVWVGGKIVADKQQNKLLIPNKEHLLSESRLITWQNRVCDILRKDAVG